MSNIRITETRKGYVAAALGAVFYGSSGLFVKLAQSSGLTTLDLLIVQHLVAVPTLWMICLIKYKKDLRINKQNLIKLLLLGGVLTSLVNIQYYESFKFLDISMATIILYTYPILLALISYVFLKQRPSRITIISLLVAFGGCILVLNLFNTRASISFYGILLGFGAALGYALFSIFVESIDSKIPPFVFITYSSSFAFLGYLLLNPPMGLIQAGISSHQLGIAVILAFVCQVPPNLLLYIAIRSIGAVRTSVITNIEIPTAALLGYWFYGETLNVIQLLRVLLVIGGILFMKNGEFLITMIHNYIRKK